MERGAMILSSCHWVRMSSIGCLALLLPGSQRLQQAFSGSAAGAQRTIAGMRFCWCPAGRFLMGSPPGEPNRRTIEAQNEAQAEVKLTHGFWIGQYDLTQAQWIKTM